MEKITITTLLERLPPSFRGRIDATKAQLLLLFGTESGEHMTGLQRIGIGLVVYYFGRMYFDRSLSPTKDENQKTQRCMIYLQEM